jgi:hypothetical protein
MTRPSLHGRIHGVFVKKLPEQGANKLDIKEKVIKEKIISLSKRNKE